MIETELEGTRPEPTLPTHLHQRPKPTPGNHLLGGASADNVGHVSCVSSPGVGAVSCDEPASAGQDQTDFGFGHNREPA